jgi:hypothetical protein
MSQVIIYKNGVDEKALLSVVYPSPDFPIEEAARKDVPAGVPYRIIPLASLPTEQEYFNAWDIDMSSPDGIGIGEAAWFAEQEVIHQQEMAEYNAKVEEEMRRLAAEQESQG